MEVHKASCILHNDWNTLRNWEYSVTVKYQTKFLLQWLGNAALGVFLDFRKAWGSINHQILFEKLSHLNLTPFAIRSYLSNRKQIMVISSNTFSDARPIKTGVPWGSILGPTLFLVYINDLAKDTNIVDLILYGDDTNLFFEARDINQYITDLNNDLAAITNGCNKNKLPLNLIKK